MVAHNIRTLDTFLRAAEGIDTKKRTRRKSRRNPDEILVKVRKQHDARKAA
jgi:hypothetical protein